MYDMYNTAWSFSGEPSSDCVMLTAGGEEKGKKPRNSCYVVLEEGNLLHFKTCCIISFIFNKMPFIS